MKKRMMGNTGIELSEVGFGAWQLGNETDWGRMADEDAIGLVHEALDADCNFFDTAPNYGVGKSEEILGKALKGKRNQVVISSKCGHHTDDVQSFEPEKLLESVEGSLKRLNTDYLDSLLLHNPPFSALDQNSPQFKMLEKLKKQGKIRAYGASVDTAKEINALLDKTDSQIIEVMFNVFYQEPLPAMKRAYEEGVGLIVKVPLDSGWLTGKYDADSTFTGIRSRWSKEDIKKRAELVDKVRGIIGEDQSMVRIALQYILSFKEISTVIPGARNSQQLQQNLSASKDLLSEDMLQALKGLWIEEIKGQPLPW
ncbi:aldo/keto reductase [Alkalibacterium sp. 20]|uniref:aldo/keto reductase n=1 Tax=Alkalibacterium sp. 20 TaxID=1798803 RepID=UPI0008FFF4F6|nr:aldo/keto reductase [Alkalibacterium sp. 20]OJF94560.1 oxidoreductase [Alkalibacterium sp. 20]